ncbi:MAG: DUF1501 domain-containing protein [Planctomycetota bacterium]
MARRRIHNTNINRRDMFKMGGGCAALTNASLLSTILNLSATNSVVAQSGDLTDYKAMVVVFLFGGNDSYNMLTPLETQERADYLTARGGVYAPNNGALGLPEGTLHQVTDSASGRRFGLHPSFGDIKDIYDAGDATFLCNVGSLIKETTKQTYQAGLDLPLGLFSHSDLQRHWMTSVPQTRSQVTGWAGRMADILNDSTNNNDNISMNISINDVNMLQTGGSVIPYIVSDSGAREVDWYYPLRDAGPSYWTNRRIFTELTDDVLSRSYGNLIERTFVEMNRTALDAAIEYNVAVDSVADTIAPFFPPDNTGTRFQRRMRMIAQTIAARDTINQKRQVFFVSEGGWDNHDELINNQEYNLMEINDGLKNFYDAMNAIGANQDVVTFTASDFARTLNSNGRGSDHAWGGNQLIMGGPVVGGRMHGQYPTTLAPGNELDLGRGRMIPTTSVDEMAAELAMWYGIDNDSNLEMVLPNIRNFDSANTGTRPIGFLS